jgi:hypothetical protein
MAKRNPRDLEYQPLERLRWDEENRAESLDMVYDHVVQEAGHAIAWYRNSKRPKKFGARLIRGLAIVFFSAAGLIPILVQILDARWRDVLPPILFQPAWPSVLIAIAAALLGVDRYFGLSSGWIRYIKTELHLLQVVEEFELLWQEMKSRWQAGAPTNDQVSKMLAEAKKFVSDFKSIIREETLEWATDFDRTQRQLESELEKMTKDRGKAGT